MFSLFLRSFSVPCEKDLGLVLLSFHNCNLFWYFSVLSRVIAKLAHYKGYFCTNFSLLGSWSLTISFEFELQLSRVWYFSVQRCLSIQHDLTSYFNFQQLRFFELAAWQTYLSFFTRVVFLCQPDSTDNCYVSLSFSNKSVHQIYKFFFPMLDYLLIDYVTHIHRSDY